MPNNWLELKKNEFLTEIFRIFCEVHNRLTREFTSYARNQTVCFQCLDELLGQETNQGRLWRLKDTAHLMFRSFSQTPLSGRSLDWALGYLFHECMKLKEDAYQLTNYVPWFESMDQEQETDLEERRLAQDLMHIASETAESIDREVRRIQVVLRLCCRLFIIYLPAHKDNPLLARCIYAQLPLVRTVFNDQTQVLLQALYGPDQVRLYQLAAEGLRLGGWNREAEQALHCIGHESIFPQERKH